MLLKGSEIVSKFKLNYLSKFNAICLVRTELILQCIILIKKSNYAELFHPKHWSHLWIITYSPQFLSVTVAFLYYIK